MSIKSSSIAEMKRAGRLKLSRGQFWEHYFIVVFFLFLTALPFVLELVEFFKETDKRPIKSRTWMIFFNFLALAVFFAIVKWRILRFKTFEISYTEEDFAEAVRRTELDREWRVESNQTEFFRATRHAFLSGSLGEMITIIKLPNKILINSISDPDYRSAITTYGASKRNVEVFMRNLRNVIKGIPYTEPKETKRQKFGNVLIRVFAFLLSLLFIVVGTFIIFSDPSISSIIMGGIILTISVFYLQLEYKSFHKK